MSSGFLLIFYVLGQSDLIMEEETHPDFRLSAYLHRSCGLKVSNVLNPLPRLVRYIV